MTGKAEATRRVETLCALLRARGDHLSLAAAAEIEGGHAAFADLVEDRATLQEDATRAKRNFFELHLLWARVPDDHRLRAAHPEPARKI